MSTTSRGDGHGELFALPQDVRAARVPRQLVSPWVTDVDAASARLDRRVEDLRSRAARAVDRAEPTSGLSGDWAGATSVVCRLDQDGYGVEVMSEPGRSLVARAGSLVATVVDIVESAGRAVAILDTTVAHSPEVLEYRYVPDIAEELFRLGPGHHDGRPPVLAEGGPGPAVEAGHDADLALPRVLVGGGDGEDGVPWTATPPAATW